MRRAFLILALAVTDALISAAAADPNCICRARGKEFELGQSICLASPKGPRIATCGMVLNNTSWQFSETPCVISAAPAGARFAPTKRGGAATLRADLHTAP
jgi:hypothetical protein